jgi:peptidoglycan biosynthesis protein MviN/MurJ (putative lipid II flippase)
VRLPIIANAVAAAIDVGIAYALIPSLDAKGAALANAAGHGTYAVIVLVYAARRIGRVDWRPGFMTRVLAASAVAGLSAWGVLQAVDGLVGVLVAIVAGSIAFAASAAALRIVPADDAAWLDESFGRSLHGGVGRIVRLWAAGPAPSAA